MDGGNDLITKSVRLVEWRNLHLDKGGKKGDRTVTFSTVGRLYKVTA